jgi:uncharacterized protein YyaL (SSP411 family)
VLSSAVSAVVIGLWLLVPVCGRGSEFGRDREESKGDLQVKADGGDSRTVVAPNRLSEEKSPYLLQHASNPVDWYPWGPEAFRKAREEDKPIFLSIGYSTCHWCHVMERESFSSPEIAAIMNENFISIKVDREERPDVDAIYMGAVQAMTGSGGWPLTVFLAPNGKPFYGGTYFPPEARYGRPGLNSLLHSVTNSWNQERAALLQQSELVTTRIQSLTEGQGDEVELTPQVLKKGFDDFRVAFDAERGGFGSAPKFPRSHVLSFLLRYWRRAQEPRALLMVEKTLDSMHRGGIYDHLGGGFHRYSTDSSWLLPHFEKMLYDQAILARTYLEAYQATANPEYAQVAREIFDYVLRELTSPEGGFYSAEDADSLPLEATAIQAAEPPEKREGAFYVWSWGELQEALGEEEAKIAAYRFGVEAEGNLDSDPHGEFRGRNVLHAAREIGAVAKQFGKDAGEVARILERARRRLFEVRNARPRPHLDDKILTDWNGLMIGSLAFGSRVLDEPRYRQAAQRAADFILSELVNEEGRLLHRYREGDSAILGSIEDYAFFSGGLFDLYEASFEARYLAESKRLTVAMEKLFWDGEGGGFYFTGRDAEKLISRTKEIYDGALPSGNSVATLGLLRVGRLTGEKELEDLADVLLRGFSAGIARAPSAYPQMLIALDFAVGPSREIVIAGTAEAPATQAMVKAVYARFLPNKVMALRPVADEAAAEITRLAPFLERQRPIGGGPTAYVCKDHVCEIPTNDIEEMKGFLDASRTAS